LHADGEIHAEDSPSASLRTSGFMRREPATCSPPRVNPRERRLYIVVGDGPVQPPVFGELVDAGDDLLPSERRDDRGSNGGGGENSAPRSPKREEDHGESEHEQVF
jgi:hypothetical protein